MKKLLLISVLIFFVVFACQRRETVQVNHVIRGIKTKNHWNAVIQRWEDKHFAILEDSTVVPVSERVCPGDTITFLYNK